LTSPDACIGVDDCALVNTSNSHKCTALQCLHYAAWKGNAGVGNLVLRHTSFHASKLQGSVWKTAMHYAAQDGFMQLCKQLSLSMDIVGLKIEDRKGRWLKQVCHTLHAALPSSCRSTQTPHLGVLLVMKRQEEVLEACIIVAVRLGASYFWVRWTRRSEQWPTVRCMALLPG
jgi:hypothetical protein